MLDRARAPVGSYQDNQLVLTGSGYGELRAAAMAGIADCVAHLGGGSASFALPAWRKWARLLTDPRAVKGWPTVFADGTGLVGAMLSVWEGVEPVGATGGHLRGLYADFLDEAAALLGAPELASCAALFRGAASLWHDVAEAALPGDVPEYARVRELAADVAAGVAAGDADATDRAQAAARLWELRLEYDNRPPVEPDFPALAAVYQAEVEAVGALRAAATDLHT